MHWTMASDLFKIPNSHASMLAGVVGEDRTINQKLLELAAGKLPSLVIDCANAADPHRLQVPMEVLHQIYVVELEMLYKFRDVLKAAPGFAWELKIKRIVVTTSNHLFNYQDEKENHDIYEHAWELLFSLGKSYPVIVGVQKESVHMPYARRFVKKWVTL